MKSKVKTNEKKSSKVVTLKPLKLSLSQRDTIAWEVKRILQEQDAASRLAFARKFRFSNEDLKCMMSLHQTMVYAKKRGVVLNYRSDSPAKQFREEIIEKAFDKVKKQVPSIADISSRVALEVLRGVFDTDELIQRVVKIYL